MNVAELSRNELVAQAKELNLELEKAPHQTKSEILVEQITAALAAKQKAPRTDTLKAQIIAALNANPEAEIKTVHAELEESLGKEVRFGYVRKLKKKYVTQPEA